MNRLRRLALSISMAVTLAASRELPAQILTHPSQSLLSIYPAGARPGETVEVEVVGDDGLDQADRLLIDGPPGISVSDVKVVNGRTVKAKLAVAADAPLGRRMVRVLNGINGLTSFRYFFVGRQPELVEAEPNNTPAQAQKVDIPAVINGKMYPNLDLDCYRFEAKKGQSMVCAVLAHGMDNFLEAHSYQGFLDTSLELLDAQGNVIAAAEDTLGLDPLVNIVIPADGEYVVRIQSLSYKGAANAVYRLTIGEVPYPTSVFPPGGRIGSKVTVEFAGLNVPAGTKAEVTIAADEAVPVQTVSPEGPTQGLVHLPLIRGEFPEVVEAEPNNDREHAQPLEIPMTANGRFLEPGDVDWYRITLAKGKGVLLRTTAQRHLRSPVDTLLEVFDAAGKKLAENDDGRAFGGGMRAAHDFFSTDSWLFFTAAADGDYFVRVAEQSGASGPRAVYRLDVEPLAPDFLVYHWPDAVPIWGPGTSAAFIVEIMKWQGIKNDISLRIEGLPEGWMGSVANWPVGFYWTYEDAYTVRFPMTITAPQDAAPGTVAPFRVVARTEVDGHVIEKTSQAYCLYGNSHNDGMLLRASGISRAVVCRPLDSAVETDVRELAVTKGETVKIPVRIRRHNEKAKLGLVANGPAFGVAMGWAPPISVPDGVNEFSVEFPTADREPGVYGILVSRSWSSDTRTGRPGPCTPVIRLTIKGK